MIEAKLIVTEGGRDRIHEICDEVVVIGTGSQADLHLRDSDASSVHCEVRWTDRGFKIVDLESSLGTTVNGKTVNQHLLENGDTIQIGKARLTFLGKSAKAPPPPRKAPAPRLRELPSNEEGEPRRFYRHESRRSGRSPAQIAAFFVGLGLVIGFLIWKGGSEYRPDETARLIAVKRDAKTAYENENLKGVEKALRSLQEIPEGSVQKRDYIDALDVLKGWRIDLIQREKDAKELARYEIIVEGSQSGEKDADWLRAKIASFELDFPDSFRLPTLKKMLKPKPAGGSEAEAGWDEISAALSEWTTAGKFGPAFKLMRGLESDSEMLAEHGDHIAVKRAALDAAYRKHYERLTRRVMKARASGKVARARRDLQSIIDLGIEPYAGQARELLKKIN